MARHEESWTRRRHEGVRAFQAFHLYLQMGADRSISKVAGQLGKSRSLLARWSTAHEWSERAGEWDAHLAKLERRAREKQCKEAAENHVNVAKSMLSRVAETLNAMAKGERGPAEEDLPKWVDTAVKIERLGLGMSTSNVEHAGKDGKALQIDLVRQARETLADKLAPVDAELARANAEAAAGLVPTPADEDDGPAA